MRTSIVSVLMFLNLNFKVDGQAKKARNFYSEIQHAIIQMQHAAAIDDPITHLPRTKLDTATAFFVKKGEALYVVTAAHVARSPFSYLAEVRVELSDGTSVEARLTMPSDKWIIHPEDGNQTHVGVDLAAMKIVDPGGLRSFIYCRNNCPTNEITVAKEDMDPPTPVLVFGFPLNEPGMKLLRSVPLGRQGIISLVDRQEDEVQVEGKYFDQLGFVIDIPTILGGSSGSPVLSAQPFGGTFLIGVVSASSAESSASPGFALAGGYAVAELASRIKELLDNPKLEAMQPIDGWCWVTESDAKRLKKVSGMPVCR